MSSFYESLTNEQCEARLKSLKTMLFEAVGEVPPAWMLESHVCVLKQAKIEKMVDGFFADFPLPTLIKFQNILKAEIEEEIAKAPPKGSPEKEKYEPSFAGGAGVASPGMPVPVPEDPKPEITRVQASVKKKPKTSKKAQT